MSGKQNGKRRVFGVKKVAEEPKTRFTRPEGATAPIERTQAAGAGNTAGTMAPKRWQERSIGR